MKKEDIIIQRLGQLEGKIDDRFGQIDARFGKIDDRFGQLEQKFDNRLGQLDEKFEGQIDSLAHSVLSLNDKVGRLDGLPERIDAFENRVTNILDGHTGMLKRLDEERISSISRFERIEGEVGVIKSHLGIGA